MKKTILLALLLTHVAGIAAAQGRNKPPKKPRTADEQEKACKGIEGQLGKFNTYEKEIMEGLRLVGSLAIFVDDKKTLRKLVSRMQGATGDINYQEFYYEFGRLACASERYVPANRSLTDPSESAHFYFWDGKMLKWEKPDGKEVDSKDPSFATKEKNVLGYSGLHTRMALSSSQTIDLQKFDR